MDDKTRNQISSYIKYSIWDINVRVFHWVNALMVIVLMGLGLAIMNTKNLGITGDGKVLLKTIHVYVGYIFVVNLIWRILWGFIGNYSASWKTIFNFGKDYVHELVSYVKSLFTSNPVQYLGHNPASRLMIAILYIMLVTQGITGLVLAGTDLYLPPFGHEIREYIANADEDHNRIVNIKPGSNEGVDPIAYKKMRSARGPVAETHETLFFLLLAAVLFHLVGVIFTEIREKNAIVSAMITGNKYFESPPHDLDK